MGVNTPNRHTFLIYISVFVKKTKKTFGYIKFLLYFCRNLKYKRK